MSSLERNVAGECRFSRQVPCRPFLRSLFTSTLSINSFTGFHVHALSAEGYLSASCISAITLTSSLGNRISLMQAMKPDRGSHGSMTFSKATRLFSRWSNSGKSSFSSCDSRAVSSATARKSLTCEARKTALSTYAYPGVRATYGIYGNMAAPTARCSFGLCWQGSDN